MSQVGIGAGRGSRETRERWQPGPRTALGVGRCGQRFESFILEARWRFPYPGKDTEPVAGPSKPREREEDGSGR